MELALFLVAATLLLLSGAGGPAHTITERANSAALMRQLFGTGDLADHDVAKTSSAFLHGHSTRFGAKRSRASAHCPVLNVARGFVSDQTLPSSAARALERKLYRTRFGFADGAYQATAPPLA